MLGNHSNSKDIFNEGDSWCNSKGQGLTSGSLTCFHTAGCPGDVRHLTSAMMEVFTV